MKNKQKIVVGITGASGAIYAKVLLEKLQALSGQVEEASVLMSGNAREIWKYELGDTSFENISFKIYDKQDFSAPFASGSSSYKTMIVCPCSMGTLGRIASGVSDDLLTRAADVMLKERRKLILVPRETPYNSIHLGNMKTITEAGGIICPASPSFYNRPESFEQLTATVIDRVLVLAGFELDTFRWNEG